MSPLWRKIIWIKYIMKRTPSPTFIRVLSAPISRVNKFFIEGISLPAALKGARVVGASMTVEATLLLPMVLFFFLHIMSFLEMLRLHGGMTFALWECGNQLTVYVAMPEEMEESVPDMAVSYLYVGNRVKSFLGKDYLDNSPMVQGSEGMSFLASNYEEDCIDIGVTYQVEPQITLFSFPYVRMANRYYARAWTGYDACEKLQYVYVTLYGEVWHQTADCTHIFITVHEVKKDRIKAIRNEAGGRYSSCELCEEEKLGDVVYYTEQGNRYHKTAECSALTRYISAVLWQDNMAYRPCSRCVEMEGGE